MKKERIFWGWFFILVILERFSFFANVSIIPRSMTGILFSIALLLICYDDVLPLEPLTPATLLLAAALGSIGFYFLLSRRTARHHDEEGKQA